MTLVIGKVSSRNTIRIFSDTAITDDLTTKRTKYLDGVVKTVIYTEKISISFAGTNVYADEVMNLLFAHSNKLDIRVLIPFLFNFHKQKNEDIEFLIGNIQYNAVGFIKISGGNCEINEKSSWIGDYEAFCRFQKEFHLLQSNKSAEQSLFKITEDAFLSVILDTEIRTVYGPIVVVEDTPNGLEYMLKTHAIRDRSCIITITPMSMHKLDFGTAKEGSFSYSCFTSSNFKKPALGYYYYEAKLGIFSYPEQSRYFKMYKNLKGNAFIKAIMDDYKIKLEGVIFEDSSMRLSE